jgi:hypothetical protein
MTASPDLERQICELTKVIRAASEEAHEPGQPLIMPWRPDSNASRLRQLAEGDDGCGCGPID